MSFDASKLKSAPWIASQSAELPCVYSGSYPEGKNLVVTAACSGILSGNIEWNKDDLEFIAAVRNAFDIQMQMGWGVERTHDGTKEQWTVIEGVKLVSLCIYISTDGWHWEYPPCGDNPIDAVLIAYEWYQANKHRAVTPQ